MQIEAEFLFDNQLIAAVEKLIRDSRKSLLLVSPFIDLDARIKDALNEKRSKYDYELNVLFGKNDNNYYKSVRKDSFDFLKQFPNIEIRYNERLHAKFYQNDFDFILTSLNLYDYSLANNIEVGIKSSYASKGLLGKALDATSGLLDQGLDKVKQEVLGISKFVNPIEKFQNIFESSDIVYKTRPRFEGKSGIQALIGKKKMDGFDVLVNKLDTLSASKEINKAAEETITTTIVSTTKTVITEVRCISANQIGKSLNIPAKEITLFMEKRGYIKDDKITEAGKLKGIIYKKYMGNDFIAYPENLEDLKDL